MVVVSNLFKDNIYAPERTVQAKVSFELLDIGAYEDASFTVSGEAQISRLSQAINKIRDMSHKYGTFERNYFSLDGTTYIPPKENEGDSELGWWTDVISGEDGTFAVAPEIEFTFTQPHNSVGLTITFDKQANEYASEFRIETYSEALIISETITGNTSPIYYFETPLDGYNRLKITILKWATPKRRARLVEVDFGVVREYTGDKLVSLKVLEEMDLLSSTVPSNEMEFVLENSDLSFNILNPNGIYRFLKMNQEMTAELGLLIGEEKYEYVTMGKFYLNEWTTDEGGLTATFLGRNIFSKFEDMDYTNLLQNTNLYDLAVDVLTQANVTDYVIDDKLKTITTVGFKEATNVREALQLIGIAGRSVVRQRRDGFLVIEQFEALTFESGYITWTGQDLFAGPTTRAEVLLNFDFQRIDLDSTFETPKVSLATQVTNLVFVIHDGTENPPSVKYVNSAVLEGIGYEIDNPLINNGQHASEVATWMFREYNLIANYEANWRQNPALECGDIIIIEDSFDNNKKARITRNEFNYIGYLEGVSNAKGGV